MGNNVKRVLICGDRNWGNMPGQLGAMHRRIEMLPLDCVIVQGEANGADRMAKKIATDFKMPVESYPAEWDKYGKSAGPIRNRQMLNTKPDLVIGFHSSIWTSKGTLDCLKEAARRGIKVELIQ
jgi:hypothetical protein